jgi:hypothetical protein
MKIYMGMPHGHGRLFDLPYAKIFAYKQLISEKKEVKPTQTDFIEVKQVKYVVSFHLI